MMIKSETVTSFYESSKARDIAMGVAMVEKKIMRHTRVMPPELGIRRTFKTAKERNKWLAKQEGQV
jgi:hypothetical protein